MSLLPSSFLPHLPRSQSSLEPLNLQDLLAHISILKELYIPPIHGGIQNSDTFYNSDEDDEDQGDGNGYEAGSSRAVRGRTCEDKQRRFSAGLADSLGGLGLDIPRSSNGLGVRTPIGEVDEDDINDRIYSQNGGNMSNGRYGRGSGNDNGYNDSEDDEEDGDEAHLDPFERDWAQKWLEGVFRRAQMWLEENELEEDDEYQRAMNVVLRDATAALAIMAGTSAAGSLTRHLLFPIDPSLAPALRSIQATSINNSGLSPETQTFLSSLSTSPLSPLTLRRRLSSPNRTTSSNRNVSPSSPTSQFSSSPTTTFSNGYSPKGIKNKRRLKKHSIPILLHDAPMGDHLGVGMQTWGSAILLGRKIALKPEKYGLVAPNFKGKGRERGVRVLELGAGTGLLSILCKKILDVKAAARRSPGDTDVSNGDELDIEEGLVVASDFLPNVLDNLRVCVDLNFPSNLHTEEVNDRRGLHVVKLDWTTFPSWAQKRFRKDQSNSGVDEDLRKEKSSNGDDSSHYGQEEEISRFMDEPFDLVLASDCVYDPTHAELIRNVIGWVLRLPDPENEGDQGGTLHIVSPLRPTFGPELESIDTHFPLLSSYETFKTENRGGTGEGLGVDRGLRIGTRGEGKKAARGKKGEGRIDETGGYWWWEVGWG